LERNQLKISHLEEGVNVIGALLAGERVKRDIRNELENPTHHHTKKQIDSLSKFSMSPPPKEIWEQFLEWSKKGPAVYSERKRKT
jgi:hypothetical protein